MSFMLECWPVVDATAGFNRGDASMTSMTDMTSAAVSIVVADQPHRRSTGAVPSTSDML